MNIVKIHKKQCDDYETYFKAFSIAVDDKALQTTLLFLEECDSVQYFSLNLDSIGYGLRCSKALSKLDSDKNIMGILLQDEDCTEMVKKEKIK